MRTITFCAAALAAAVAVAGCGSSKKSSTSAAGTSSQAQAPAPAATPKGQVKFTSPNQGATTSSTVKFTVALKDFKINPAAVGMAPRPGEGHLHFTMDGGKFDYPKYSGPNGLIAKKLGVTGHYSPALAPYITYKGLPPGKHTLEVYLANNNHTNVGVDTTRKFTVK